MKCISSSLLFVLALLPLSLLSIGCTSSSSLSSYKTAASSSMKFSTSSVFATSFGVNMAGADFGNVPGVYGTDYIYPSGSELPYFVGKGLKMVRLPIKWERIQPQLLQPLDPAELARLQNFIAAAGAANSTVLVDLHNYGTYYGTHVGTGNVSLAAYADLWTRLAQSLNSVQGLGGYDLMNEPVGFATAQAWPQAAQAAVSAIRAVDGNTTIYVEGDCWASAANWQNCNGTLDIQDSSQNLIYEAHQYFDADASGQYLHSYDTDGTYPTIGVDRLAPFVKWLQANGHRGYIGEYGIPDSDSRYLTVLQNTLTYMDQNCLSGTYWAGGPWWGGNALAVEPINGQDRPQMSVLSQHTGQSSCSIGGAVSAGMVAPDLVVTSINMTPSQPMPGQSVTFTATIKNQGNGATPAGTTSGVAFLVDGVEVTWAGGYSNSIAAGSSVTVSADGGPNGSVWTATSGNHSIEAFVNDVHRYTESNVNNNTLSESFSVAVANSLPVGKPINIMNMASGQDLDDSGASYNAGNPIIQWPSTGGANQKWVIGENSDGTYYFLNQFSGLCLDVPGASQSPGAKIQQWSCNGTGAQRFHILASANGSALIVNVNSGFCLDNPGATSNAGTQYQQWNCNGSSAQNFIIQ